jgi:ribosomal protein S18 acetylase RimI-like enzyme
MITIRLAKVDDAAALESVGRETFRETFGHLYPSQDLKAFLDSAHPADNYYAWILSEAYGVWIAELDGQAVGYAVAGTCDLPHPNVTPTCGELKRIYLLNRAQNSGAGTRLMCACFDWLAKPGRRLWIGVWSQNYGAQRLYGRHGFTKVGEYEFPVGEARDREFILSR